MIRNRTLLAVSVAVGCAYIGIGMVVPVRVLYAQSRGASLAVIGGMASAYLLANFLFQLPSGWIADRWGRKRIMASGLLIQACLSLVYLVITDPVLFVVLRFAEGIAGAAILPPARALLVDTIPEAQRGRAYGIFNSFFNAGFLLGPAAGGVLASAGYGSVFAVAFLFRLAAILPILLLIPTDAPRRGGEGHQAAPVRPSQLFSLPLVGTYILTFGDSLFLGFDLTLLPLWMRHHLGATVAAIGFAYAIWAVPNIVTAPLGGRLADRVRRSNLILVFGLAQVPLYVAYGALTSLTPVLVLFGLHGLIYALVQPAVDTQLAASSPPTARARAQSIYIGIGMGSAFVAANGATFLYSLDWRLPLYGMAIGFGCCVLVGGALVRLSESRGQAVPAGSTACAAE